MNFSAPSGKCPQKMIMYDHRLRTRLAVKLAVSVVTKLGPGEQREDDVVLAHLAADLAPDPLELSLHLVGVLPALADRRDVQVVQGDAPLEEQRQQGVVDGLAEVDGMPLLVAGHAQDAVADVVVLADHVGEGVMDKVVRVLPLLRGAGGVPLPGAGVDLRVVHPIPLPVQHVVPDLHVLEDLAGGQHGRTGDPRRGERTGEQGDARRRHQAPLNGDHPADVGRVSRVSGLLDVAPELVELARPAPRPQPC